MYNNCAQTVRPLMVNSGKVCDYLPTQSHWMKLNWTFTRKNSVFYSSLPIVTHSLMHHENNSFLSVITRFIPLIHNTYYNQPERK